MQLTTYISVKAMRFLDKSGFSKKLPLTEIIEEQSRARDFVSHLMLPARAKIVYRCEAELAMGKNGVAYYHYVPANHSKRKVILFIDKILTRIERNKKKYTGPLKTYIGGILVHEFCHVQELFNKFPLAYKYYEDNTEYRDRVLMQYYEYICEYHAEDMYLKYLRSQGVDHKLLKPVHESYACLFKGLDLPKDPHKRIERLMNVCKLMLGREWFEKVALNPPDFDDFRHPEDYAELIR